MTNLLAAAVKEHGIYVFALSPGGPSGMAEILANSPKVSEQLRMGARETLRTGAGTAESVTMLMFLLSGKADALAGRHISRWDNAEELVRRSGEIVQNDLYTLRLRV